MNYKVGTRVIIKNEVPGVIVALDAVTSLGAKYIIKVDKGFKPPLIDKDADPERKYVTAFSEDVKAV